MAALCPNGHRRQTGRLAEFFCPSPRGEWGSIRRSPGFSPCLSPILRLIDAPHPRAPQSGRRLNLSCRNRAGRSSCSRAAHAACSTPTATGSLSTADARSTSAQTPSPAAGEGPCLRSSRVAIRRDPSGAVPVCVARMNRTPTPRWVRRAQGDRERQ